MKISFAGMEKLVENDLSWFFNSAYAELGFRSNFPEQIRIQNKLKIDDIHLHLINKIHIIDRKRNIEQIFFSLPTPQQNCLWAMFGSNPICKPELRLAFARYTPIICHFHPEIIDPTGEINKDHKKHFLLWLEEGRAIYIASVQSFYNQRKSFYQAERDQKKRNFRIIK